MTYVLNITGHVPSKKNGKVSRGGAVVTTRAPRSIIDPLVTDAVRQWRTPTHERRPPLAGAVIRATFFVRNGRADLDNKLTTLLDVLREAGVIQNDSIARLAAVSARAKRMEGTVESVIVRVREIR